jgi:hypothetical protein
VTDPERSHTIREAQEGFATSRDAIALVIAWIEEDLPALAAVFDGYPTADDLRRLIVDGFAHVVAAMTEGDTDERVEELREMLRGTFSPSDDNLRQAGFEDD